MDELLTKDDVAKALRVSIPTVDRLMKRGLPYVKLGDGNGAVRFDKEAVKAWVEGKTIEPTAAEG